jgi:hypothetical protein
MLVVAASAKGAACPAFKLSMLPKLQNRPPRGQSRHCPSRGLHWTPSLELVRRALPLSGALS